MQTTTEKKVDQKRTNGKASMPVPMNEMRTETVHVTPAMAEEWLKANSVNRAISRATVEMLVAEILSGSWVLTEQGIAFDIAGNLVDGQHRLTAIVRAGKTVPIRVTHNAPSIRAPRDRGRGRRVGDFLYWSDGTLVEDGQLVAAMVVLLENLAGNTRRRGSASRGQEILSANEEGFRFVCSFVGRSAISTPVLASIAFAYPTNHAKVGIFTESYRSGVNLAHGSPILALRNSTREKPKTSGDRRNHMYRTFNAVRAFVQGRRLVKTDNSPGGYEWVVTQRQAKGLES
jgi:hypothetical protein